MQIVHPARKRFRALILQPDERIDLAEAALCIAWEEQGAGWPQDTLRPTHTQLSRRTASSHHPGSEFVKEIGPTRGDPRVRRVAAHRARAVPLSVSERTGRVYTDAESVNGGIRLIIERRL